MTPVELLEPRYIVLTPFPGSIVKEGEIIKPSPGRSLAHVRAGEEKDYLSDYPKIFRLLKWSDARNEKELPQYVSFMSVSLKKRIFHKAEQWAFRPSYKGSKPEWMYSANGNHWECIYDSSLPATEEEYLEYKNTKTTY